MPLTMKEKILDAVERRVRGASFAEMSFRDVASDVGIKSAGVHYHSPSKQDLGEALVERYASQFKERLDEIDTDDLDATLDSFVSLYAQALVLEESICLCAVMGAEAIGLPDNVNQKTRDFFSMNKAWLEGLFARHGNGAGSEIAAMIVAALEGGTIIASASKDKGLFEQIAGAAIRCARTKSSPI